MRRVLSTFFTVIALLSFTAGCGSATGTQNRQPEQENKEPEVIIQPTTDIPSAPAVGSGNPVNKLNLLQDAEREDLAICVEVLPDAGVKEEEAVAKVNAGLDRLKRMPPWSSFGFDMLSTRVLGGCPSGPHLLKPGVVRNDPNSPTPIVEKASPYLLFVFVLPDTDIRQLFADAPDNQTAIQEVIRFGNDMHPVSTGIYIGPNDMESERLAHLLKKGLGI
jgi:hypothetical protein